MARGTTNHGCDCPATTPLVEGQGRLTHAIGDSHTTATSGGPSHTMDELPYPDPLHIELSACAGGRCIRL